MTQQGPNGALSITQIAIVVKNLRFVYLDSQPLLKFILEVGGGDASDDAEWDLLKPTYIYPTPD